jgi:diacylglycerol kinase (ATP)
VTHVVLAVNPTAGRGYGRGAGEQARDQLSSAGIGVTLLTGDSGQSLRHQITDSLSAAQSPDALVVVGGDGATHLAVNALAGTDVPLGIIAAGTGNDIARCLGLPVRDPGASADMVTGALLSGQTRQIDTVHCQGAVDRWFVGSLSAGFDAMVNERANGWRWPRHRIKYDLAILRELPVLRPRHYRLVLDGQVLEVEALLVAAANNPDYGGGMKICPDARNDDGLLDVLIAAPMSRRAFVRLYPQVYRGRHVDHPAVTIRRAARVEIACDGIVGYADGERMGSLPLTLDVAPGALHVLAPPKNSPDPSS